MSIKTILIDDEESSRNVIKALLKKFCPEINIIAEAENVKDAYKLINDKQPSLIFLDIQMPGGNGFTLLKKFDKVDFDVIFVTSFDQYAINAIKYSALDYLLKPIEVDDLKQAVKRAVERQKERGSSVADVVKLLIENETAKEKQIAIHSGSKVRIVKLNEIACVEADSQYTNLYLSGGEKINSTKTLKEFEELLCEAKQFIRVNRSCVVNTIAILTYTKAEPFIITLNNGREYEMSRRKKVEVLALLR